MLTQLLLVGAASGCGSESVASTPSQRVSPTPNVVALAYVSLVHDFWIHEQAADVVSNGSNLAAKVCLGMDPPGRPAKLQLVDPVTCGQRAVALLAVHQRFIIDLASTPAPPQFAADEQVFRTQITKTIADLKALIVAAQSGSQNAVLEAATVYNNDMYPTVTDALNDVDPSVSHP